ncbi:MAG: hypothetical protein ACOYEB_07370 [Enterococcus lemanii]
MCKEDMVMVKMGIKYGSLYRENEKLKNFLPNYYNGLNDQKYHLWVPIKVKTDTLDTVYMIDTYQAYPVYGGYDKIVEKLKEYGKERDNSWYANQVYNYCYSAKVELNEDTIQAFDFYIDLDDYRVLKKHEEDLYKDEDIVRRIKLYFEHNYPNGLTLVRKDAKVDYEHKLGKLFNRMIYDELSPPYISRYSLSEINELSNKVKDTKKIDIVNKLNDKLNALIEEYKEYYNALIKEAEVKE